MTDHRASVLRAAAQLFQTRGINATTIQDITEATGIAKGGFYTHFDSKDQLILELVQHFYDDIVAKAARQATPDQNTAQATLHHTILAELEVATDYQNFLHAVAMDFPPHSTGPVPETVDTIHRRLHVWHKHILTEAFGNRVQPYLVDLVVVLEGAINQYLMRSFWQGTTPPFDLIAGFITHSLHAIVLADDQLTPAFSADGDDEPNQQSPLESISEELTVIQTTMDHMAGSIPTLTDDLAAIDLILDELQHQSPRQFLIEALLTHLSSRDYLTTDLTSTLASWNIWKGTPQ